MDGFLDALGKFPALAASWGQMFQAPWTVTGLMALLAAFVAWQLYRTNQALLAEKDKRIVDISKTGVLAVQMLDVLVLLGRKAPDPPRPPSGGGG